MKKMFSLMLFLMIWGAANVTSQVRIGGNGAPNGAAVLDLNATDVTINGTKGLALPRVSLSTNTVEITSGTPNLSGMLVYNTSTALGAGVYYWDGNNWVKVTDGSTDANNTYSGSTSITLSGDSFLRAELTGDVTAPANSNATTIANGAVTNAKITNGAVDSAKIAANAIRTTHIINNAVTSVKIADGAVTSVKIAQNAVGLNNIRTTSGIVRSNIAVGARVTVTIDELPTEWWHKCSFLTETAGSVGLNHTSLKRIDVSNTGTYQQDITVFWWCIAD